MIARILVSLGAVAATVGFTLYGMATTYIRHRNDLADTSYYLMGAGIVATVVGVIWYRADERKAEALIRERASTRR